MLMKEFRKVIAPNAVVKIESYHTGETIKDCKAIDLSEDDMKLVIQSIHASVYFNASQKAYLGMFILTVTED